MTSSRIFLVKFMVINGAFCFLPLILTVFIPTQCIIHTIVRVWWEWRLLFSLICDKCVSCGMFNRWILIVQTTFVSQSSNPLKAARQLLSLATCCTFLSIGGIMWNLLWMAVPRFLSTFGTRYVWNFDCLIVDFCSCYCTIYIWTPGMVFLLRICFVLFHIRSRRRIAIICK